MHSYFSVTTPSGGHLGCIDLYFTTAQGSVAGTTI